MTNKGFFVIKLVDFNAVHERGEFFMEIKAKTLVGMIGRRDIRDHKREFAELLGLDPNDRELIKTIKLALRAQVTATTLRAELQLQPDSSLTDIAEAAKARVRHLKDLRAWNIKTSGDVDDELDQLNRALYRAAMSH